VQRITPLQVYMLFVQFLYATTLGFYVRYLAGEAGFSAVYSVVLGSMIGMILVYLSYRLAVRRPTRFLGEYGREIVGKWVHLPLILLMVFSFVFAAAFVLRELEELIAAFYLKDTPFWAIAALMGICIARAVRSGAETIFRGAQGLFIFGVISSLSIPLWVSRETNGAMAAAFFTHFLPSGLWNSTLLITTLFGEMTMLVFLFPYFSEGRRTMRMLGWATVTSVFITLSGLISILMLFGPDMTANLTVPMLEMIRYARFGSFFQNLDPLLLVFWLYSMFIKISLFMFAAVIGLTHAFGMKDYRPLSTLMTASMVILTLCMVKSGVELDALLKGGALAFLLLTELIPALYLVVDWIRSARTA